MHDPSFTFLENIHIGFEGNIANTRNQTESNMKKVYFSTGNLNWGKRTLTNILRYVHTETP